MLEVPIHPLVPPGARERLLLLSLEAGVVWCKPAASTASPGPRKGFNHRKETTWGYMNPERPVLRTSQLFISMGFPVCYTHPDPCFKNLFHLHLNPFEFLLSIASSAKQFHSSSPTQMESYLPLSTTSLF